MELLWERMTLTWSTPGVVQVKVDGRTFTAEGEVGPDRHPDFTVYARDLNSRDDGVTFRDAGEKDDLLRNLVLAARKRRWNFQIDMSV